MRRWGRGIADPGWHHNRDTSQSHLLLTVRPCESLAPYAEMLANGKPVLSESKLSWLVFEFGLAVLLYLPFKVALVGQLLARAKTTRTRTGRVTLAMRVTLTPLLVTGSV